MKANDKWIAELNQRSPDGLHHGEWLIQRIIVPERAPMVVKSSSMKMDRTLPQVVTIDRCDERDGRCAINAAIRPAHEADDQVTAELLQRIVLREEGRLVWAEQHSDQIEQTGREDVLVNQNTVGPLDGRRPGDEAMASTSSKSGSILELTRMEK